MRQVRLSRLGIGGDIMLIEKTLFGIDDKVKTAIEILKDLQPDEGYYVADSGGKDSCVILELVKMADVKFDAHHSLTTIDPPELVYFLRDHHPETEVHRPKKPFLTALVKNGFPQRQIRWCCKEYKEIGGSGRLVLTGVRAAESHKRAKRNFLETCTFDPSKRYLHIIFTWSELDVWEFIKKYNVPYCKLYDEGNKRIGCLFCPMAGSQRLKDVKKYPGYVKAFKKAFNKLYEKGKEREAFKRWKSGEEMFDWWISENIKTEDESQGRLFYEE